MREKRLWRFLREPLFHFCLIGSLLFIVSEKINNDRERADNLIIVSSARISQLKFQFESTWKRPPSAKEINNLIEGHIREEVYYRGALSLELDRNDAVVRRRMVQKMEFLIDTGSYLEEPVAGELEAYFTANNQSFRQSALLAIEQIYLGEEPDLEKVSQILTTLNSRQDIDIAALGERTFLPGHLGLSTTEVVDGVFGNGFFEQVLTFPQESWSGPVRSSFGAHLVRIVDRLVERTPAFSEIRDLVRKDWRAAKALEVRQKDYLARRSHFVIEIDRE